MTCCIINVLIFFVLWHRTPHCCYRFVVRNFDMPQNIHVSFFTVMYKMMYDVQDVKTDPENFILLSWQLSSTISCMQPGGVKSRINRYTSQLQRTGFLASGSWPLQILLRRLRRKYLNMYMQSGTLPTFFATFFQHYQSVPPTFCPRLHNFTLPTNDDNNYIHSEFFTDTVMQLLSFNR